MTATTPPDALLFVTSGCKHCPTVLKHLSELVKSGRLGRLEVINASVRPDLAETMGIRSAPWFRIGEFELEGAHGREELQLWCERAGQGDGYQFYLWHLLEHAQLDRVIEMVRQRPQRLADLTAPLSVADSPMVLRIGIAAVLEEFAGSPDFSAVVPSLLGLVQAESAMIRLDACHLLGLSDDPRALPAITALLQDPDPEVREVARESLDNLNGDA